MDQKEALELLKQYQSELERFKTLKYDNSEWPQWKFKVKVVVVAAFGNESEEYQELNPAPSTWFPRTDGERQKEYLNDLNQYELRIKEILQRYEILGISS